ncbi:malate dehydrogenase-like [Choristoneura fumiferana]|uniref:malate dehydrogenase-like n=1 Tax=Choristoneura fumiferana TaxID=7141 RepID=UPI003D15D58D
MLVTRNFAKCLVQSTINMTARSYQVSVMGGASEIGQIISFMLRTEPSVTSLVVHDMRENTPGIVLDLSHIPVNSRLMGFCGHSTIERALKDSDLVLFVGGVIKSPTLTNEAWFETNTAFIKNIAARVGKMAQMPFIGIVTEPINVLVPMAAEIMRCHGAFDPKKLFGITTIDWIRAQTLYATEHKMPPKTCFVPVIGGHSEKTIIPLLSHSRPTTNMKDPEIMQFTRKIQECDDIVSQAKQGLSSTMSIAYSVVMFAREIFRALDGQRVKVNAYVENNDFGTSYFSGLVNVDKDGMKSMQRFTKISQYECNLLEKATEQLRKDVARGKKILEVA